VSAADRHRISLLPPGATERVAAERALVLAPHQDDEVLGCGGLLAQLGRQGTSLRVLFLTDGSGGPEGVADPERYRARRREEAVAACAVLGIGAEGVEFLDLVDGALAAGRQTLADAVRARLLAWRPDLLLVPSPLEVTADHQAAFAAVHDVLGGLRPEDAASSGEQALLARVAAGLSVLAYEVNHPAYPNLLVDVSGELETLACAMACYASQEERHRYLEAGLGLRRYRCLSLAPEVEAAEGYRRLTLADFATRSPAALVRALGGVPELLVAPAGPRISVVVRTRDRPRLLAEALASIAASTYRQLEVVLVNDGGVSPEVAADFPFPLQRVEHPASRGRAAAANAGIAAASGEVVCFLDDDDLVFPEHFATLAEALARLDGGVVYSDAAVGVYELDGNSWSLRERRLPYSRDFDPDLLLVDNYIPFNTLAIERRRLLALGPAPLDETLPFFEDWELLQRLAATTRFVHLRRTTCEYRHFRGGGHHVFGERPAERADFLATKAAVIARQEQALEPARLAAIVERMRGEIVAWGELAGSTRATLADESRQRAELLANHRLLAEEHRRLDGAYAELDRRFWRREEEYHRLNGDLAALRGDRDRLLAEASANSRELDRLYQVERELRGALAVQGEEVARLHGEVAELHPVRGELAATRQALEVTQQGLDAAGRRVGELTGALGQTERAAAELSATVADLHAEVARQAADLGRRDQALSELQGALGAAQQREGELWREIERLRGLVAAMETTRAWRLHRMVERLRGRG
jgi:LmbE family N-acetylglucosaminyl deacetylase